MKTKARTAQFLVTLEVPKGVTLAEIEGYIKEAVQVWCKSGDGGCDDKTGEANDPLFDLDAKSVKVKQVKQQPLSMTIEELASARNVPGIKSNTEMMGTPIEVACDQNNGRHG